MTFLLQSASESSVSYRLPNRLFLLALLLIVAIPIGFPTAASAAFDVTSPTTNWNVIGYGNNFPDPSNDQQTGSSEGDIVGNLAHPSLYAHFDGGGTPSLTDGTLAIRVRVGADVNPVGFKTAFFIGIDANGDGALDLFLGVNNSGAADKIGIWNPGAGLNISPSTTTIVSTALVSYTPTSANYYWAPVNLTLDPTVGTATDLDGGGQNDYFLTFSIAFSDVVAQLASKGITGVTENTAFSFVAATATQANSLNQDLNGVGKNYDGSSSWTILGVQSDSISMAGIPEPRVGLFLACGLAGLACCRLRQAKRFIRD